MPKRGNQSDEPSTSSPPEQLLDESSMDGILDETSNDKSDEPPTKKLHSQDYEGEEDEGENESNSRLENENDDEIMVEGDSRPNSSTPVSSVLPEEDEEVSRSPDLEFEEEEEEDDEEDDSDSVFDSTVQVAEIDSKFLDICLSLKLKEDVIQGGWELFYHAGQRVLLEGDQKGWQMVAVYYYILSKDVKKMGRIGKKLTEPLNCTLNQMLDSFSISAVEFFDKMHRFIDTIHSRKRRRFTEFVKKAQESLAVTTVIYKKFLKIFQLLFIYVSPEDGSQMASSQKVFELIWTAFLNIKRGLQSEDLISCHHLLFCVVDTVFTEICNQSHSPAEQHLNPTFVETLLSQDITVLRALCMYFDGVILDAKHFTEHVYPGLPKESIPDAWFLEDHELTLAKMNSIYSTYILETGQIDERIFIPTEVEVMLIFDNTFDSDRVTRILRRGVNNEDFEDADFLNKVSVQNCLDKISLTSEKNGGNSSPSDVARVPNVKSDENEILRCPEDKDPAETAKRLARIVGSWSLETSDLKFHCDSMSDNPTATLLLKRDVLSERFSQKIVEEVDNDATFDEGFHANVIEHRQLLERLFMKYIERIMLTELRKKCREEDLLNVLRREEFLDAVFCFCIELVLFANGSVREFPWSAQICDLHPFLFHKVIDLMINHEKGLSRPMVQHFNQIEERIIEELAWKKDSPLWQMIVRCPLSSFNEFGEDWFEKGQSPLKFTPIKKRLATDDLGRPILSSNGQSRTVRVFMKRTYFTAALRLHDLCDRIGMGVRPKSQVWTLFDFVLRSETSQLMQRHLDQILMCCVYVVSKINSMTTTFMEIMAHYKRQPQALSEVYRKVPVDSKLFADKNASAKKNEKPENEILTLLKTEIKYSHVDLIKYYNLVFRDRVKSVIHEIESAGDNEMTEMPVPTCYGLAPVKINLSKTVAIQALPKTMHGSSRQELVIANITKNGISYDVLQSPRKELLSINQRLSTII